MITRPIPRTGLTCLGHHSAWALAPFLISEIIAGVELPQLTTDVLARAGCQVQVVLRILLGRPPKREFSASSISLGSAASEVLSSGWRGVWQSFNFGSTMHCAVWRSVFWSTALSSGRPLCGLCVFCSLSKAPKISFPCVVVLRNDARGGVAANVLAEVVMVAVGGDCDDIRGACGGSTFSDLSLRLCDHLQRPFVVLCEVLCSNHPSSSSKDQWCHRALQEL